MFPSFFTQLRQNEPDYVGCKILALQPTFPAQGDSHTVRFNRSIGIFAVKHWNGAQFDFEIDRKEYLPFTIVSSAGTINFSFRFRMSVNEFHTLSYPLWTTEVKITGAQAGGNSAILTIFYI